MVKITAPVEGRGGKPCYMIEARGDQQLMLMYPVGQMPLLDAEFEGNADRFCRARYAGKNDDTGALEGELVIFFAPVGPSEQW